jgi:hypothetical protein
VCFQHLSSHTLWLLGGLGGPPQQQPGAEAQQQAGAQLLLALQGFQRACSLTQQLRRSLPGLDCQPLQPLLLQLLAAVCSQPLQQQHAGLPGEAQPSLAAVGLGRSGIRLQGLVLWVADQLAGLPEGMQGLLRAGLLRLLEERLLAAGLEGLVEEVESLLGVESCRGPAAAS